MRLLFMGTPDFAVHSLEALIKAGHEVIGVVTQPDKPVGRKKVLTAPPVKEAALKHGIEVYQPETLKGGTIEGLLEGLDIIVVVAYGKILPSYVLNAPKYGCVNVHGSLLPKLRGSAPIQRSIINGDKYAGVTTMYMAKGLDTGDMILKEQLEIEVGETSEMLYSRLAPLGAALLVKTLEQIENGSAPREVQNDAEATHAPPLSKQEAIIDFNSSPFDIIRKICGMNPWPVAETKLDGKRLKIYMAHSSNERAKEGAEIGDAYPCDGGIAVVCKEGELVILTDLQLEGSKRMDAKVFLNGRQNKEMKF